METITSFINALVSGIKKSMLTLMTTTWLPRKYKVITDATALTVWR